MHSNLDNARKEGIIHFTLVEDIGGDHYLSVAGSGAVARADPVGHASWQRRLRELGGLKAPEMGLTPDCPTQGI